MVLGRVTMPFPAVRVTCSWAPSASESLTEMPVLIELEKTYGVPAVTICTTVGALICGG